MDYYFVNPYPSPNHAHSDHMNMAPPSSEFILSDFLMFDDDGGGDGIDHHQECRSQSTESSDMATFSDVTHGFGETSSNNNMQVLFFPLVYSLVH